ncbi:8-oxo-dGTP diphosphatase [Tilletia horrida]|nr:8-oxo-dGTP diphosphatase [Tilletia horrida]
MASSDPWAEEETSALDQQQSPSLSAMVSSSSASQDEPASTSTDTANDVEEDENAPPPTAELHTLNLSSAPASSNPWAESLPSDPLAPSLSSTIPSSAVVSGATRPTDPTRQLSSLSSASAAPAQGAAGTGSEVRHDPTPSATTYAREWAEYDGAHFGVGLEKLGHACARYWSFKPRYTNLNAGAFGACPTAVCQVYKEIQDEIEACPDYFVDATLPSRLRACRERVAPLLNVSADDVVFVPNTTTAFHSVIRDLPSTTWDVGDAVLTVSTTYGAIGLNVQHAADARGEDVQGGVRRVEVPLVWPLTDDALLKAVEEVVVRDQSEEALKARGGKGRIRLAVFDAISSMPGIRLPWEKLVALAKKHKIMSFIDGAHSIGQIQLDIGAADPDFFVSNCHKWLYAHRGCAVFYVARRNQHLVHGVPVSWMYLPASQRAQQDEAAKAGSLPVNSWRAQWEFSGTVDWSSLVTVEAGLDFRKKLGGERRIMAYQHWLALRGGQAACKILGTELLEVLEDTTLAAVTNDPDDGAEKDGDKSDGDDGLTAKKHLPQRQRPHTMAMVNLRLPLIGSVYSPSVTAERKAKVKRYFFRTLWDEYRTAIPVYEHGDRLWARMCGAVFLEVGDFEFGARALKEVCQRLNEGTADLTSEPVDLGPLTDESLAALRNLARHKPAPEPCPNAVPAFRRAAVLLALFGGRHGDLYVVLSKRAAQLRSHSGDTAIPGGRFEAKDHDLEETACGLPMDSRRVQKLCELEPFLSANELVVTPIVVLLIDPLIKPSLNPNEVDALFSLPFKAFLSHSPSEALRAQLKLPLQPSRKDLEDMPRNEVSGPSDWHTCRDILWLGGNRVRRHTFWDTRNPVRGLTSDILIHAASIGYAAQPDFSLTAPGQPTQADLIKLAFLGPMAVKKRRVRPRMTMLPQPMDEDRMDGSSTESHTVVDGVGAGDAAGGGSAGSTAGSSGGDAAPKSKL